MMNTSQHKKAHPANHRANKEGHPSPLRVSGIVFDWAGTLVDFGSMAPIIALVEAFRRKGLHVTHEQARRHMGLAKRDHIDAMLAEEELRAAWTAKFGTPPGQAAIDAFYEEFVPLQLEVIAEHCKPLPGVLQVLETLRERGILMGTSTGYTREMVDALHSGARVLGLELDSVACSSDVPTGRPAPWMCLLNAQRFDIYPVAAMIKVGDTPIDIEEGRNAGMWTISTVVGGNEIGMSQREFEALSEAEQLRLITEARTRLAHYQPHFLIDSIEELPAIVARIDRLLQSGERP